MNKQKGMTFIGMVMTMAIVVITAVFIMRIVPVYLQHYSIVSSIKALNQTPRSSLSGDPMVDADVLKVSLIKRFDINGLDYLKEDELMISMEGENTYVVKVKYKVVRPLVYNMSLLFDFNDTIKVVTGSEH